MYESSRVSVGAGLSWKNAVGARGSGSAVRKAKRNSATYWSAATKKRYTPASTTGSATTIRNEDSTDPQPSPPGSGRNPLSY